MPVYEFHCPSCHIDYEERVDRMGETAPCPQCGTTEVQRLMSASAIHTKSSASSAPACPSGKCDWSGPPCCGGSCGMN